VEPCNYGESEGYYDNQTGELDFGLQFHSFIYPDEAENTEDYGKVTSLFWHPKMRKGEIIFPKPAECTIKKPLHKMPMKEFVENVNFKDSDVM
jgi:CRISPR-associated protein Cas5d